MQIMINYLKEIQMIINYLKEADDNKLSQGDTGDNKLSQFNSGDWEVSYSNETYIVCYLFSYVQQWTKVFFVSTLKHKMKQMN